MENGKCPPHANRGIDNPALETDTYQGSVRKFSKTESFQSTVSQHSKTRFSDNGDDNPRSWWYAFCLKCRSKESASSWQPPFWSYLCPYPFCPTFRRFSRITVVIITCLIAYCVFYSIVGTPAAPGNPLFQLIILVVCAKIGGWLVSLTNLPGLIGMLFTGILLQNVNIVNLDESLTPVTTNLGHTALVIILIRAGLDLDPAAMKKLKFTILKLGLLPWLVEALAICAFAHLFLNFPVDFAFALGSVVAAVSPAVTVTCVLRLRSKGYGVAKGIPTVLIAIAGIDDAFSVAVFRIMQSIIFSTGSMVYTILQAPVSVLGGIAFGVLWGFISNYFPEKGDPYVVPLRVFLLMAGCMLSVFGSEAIKFGGAGPLACVTAAFSCIVAWTRQGWNTEDNPVAISFEIIWMFFEPILFGVTGTKIRLNEMDGQVVLIGVGILIAATIIRVLATIIFGIQSGFNIKEKLFSSLALMSKATVQAALAPVFLNEATKNKPEAMVYAKEILMICVLSIVLTAPLSAVLMTVLGPKLLTRTKPISDLELRNKSFRRSIRDIAIDEEKDTNCDKDPEIICEKL